MQLLQSLNFSNKLELQTKTDILPILEHLQDYFLSLDRILQLLCYRIFFLEQEERVMRALAVDYQRAQGAPGGQDMRQEQS